MYDPHMSENSGQLLWTRDVASRLGVSVRTVARMVQRRELIPLKESAEDGLKVAYVFRESDVAELQQRRRT